MTGKELIACIALVVIICFIIAALLGAMRVASQNEKQIEENDLMNIELKKFILDEELRRERMEADMKKLREEPTKLCKECIVLRHEQQEQEDENGQKERNEKV